MTAKTTDFSDSEQLNGLALAYLGDAVYETFVRVHLVQKGLTRPNVLQHRATRFVSAKAQAWLMNKLLADPDRLTLAEQNIYKRGRNSKSHTSAKNTDIITYRISTGFEAVFGYLQLQGQTERVKALAQWCIQEVEAHEQETKRQAGSSESKSQKP